MSTSQKKKSAFRSNRVYLQPGEILHAPSACVTCATVAGAIRTDKAGRRMIPEAVLETSQVLTHLEQDVLGRPVDYGDPTRYAGVLLAGWYAGGDR